MPQPAAGAHGLQLARADLPFATGRVSMRQGARVHPGENFHVVVRMHTEALTTAEAVLIDDAQRAKAHVARVMVVVETKAVLGVQPGILKSAAFG